MDYAIGDIQGMYDELLALLDKINYQDGVDRLWFVGDLVNRGPKSADVLSLLMSLKTPPIITLGNHDLHLLARYYQAQDADSDDTLSDVLTHLNAPQMMQWIRQQHLCYFDPSLNIFMSHAGLPPCWSIEQALALAQEVETALTSADPTPFLKKMYGNLPSLWDDKLQGFDRLRIITNYFTRMRWLGESSELLLDNKGANAPKNARHWFKFKRHQPVTADIIFGHWAAIEGVTDEPTIHAIDTGCVWGGNLTAICLQTKTRYTHQNPTN